VTYNPPNLCGLRRSGSVPETLPPASAAIRREYEEPVVAGVPQFHLPHNIESHGL